MYRRYFQINLPSQASLASRKFKYKLSSKVKGQLGVSNGLCEHASTAYFLAGTSSDQICLASSEHFRKYDWRTANTSINFPLILHVGLLGYA